MTARFAEPVTTKVHHDHAALIAAAHGAGLCTIVGVEGGFSRRLGSQLAVLPGGEIIGSLADGCLEQQLRRDLKALKVPRVIRYGKGSPLIDFRLPCGGGLDILLDPFPDRHACLTVANDLKSRRASSLVLPENALLPARRYVPQMVLNIFGHGPEVATLAKLALASDVPFQVMTTDDLSLGSRPNCPVPDQWTATVLLFHDHELEIPIIAHALQGTGFYLGAQGGLNARIARNERMREIGLSETEIERVRAPVGLIPSCRDPSSLAVSILAEIFAAYDKFLET